MLLAFLAAVCLAGCSDDDSGSDPEDARARELASPVGDLPDDLPEVEAADDTRSWLEGDGEAALLMVDATERLLDVEPDCARVTEDLEEAGTPEQLLAASAGTPDQTTAQLLMDLHSTLLGGLPSCASGDFAEHQQLLAWQWLVVVERLDEIGVEA